MRYISLTNYNPPDPRTIDQANVWDLHYIELRDLFEGYDRIRILGLLQTEALGMTETFSSRMDKGTVSNGAWVQNVLRQTGLECQTLCLLNGIQAIKGEDAIRGLDVTSIRRNLTNQFSINQAASYLKSVGYIQEIEADTNPLAIIHSLYHEDAFLGICDERQFHAYTILTVKHPTAERFALRLDSLGGRQEYLPFESFVNELLDRRLDKYIGIYKPI